MNRVIGLLIFGMLVLVGLTPAMAGPYAPAAGQPGTTAVYMGDAALVGWAAGYVNYLPGADVDAIWQVPANALGAAQGTAYDIVCLGRGGRITLTFNPPIRNRSGWDLAVFENSFSDYFLELGYLEVSSDGITFVRFYSSSLTPAPVGAYGALDPTNIDGLAGKYRQGYGTPFDLQNLWSKPEVLSGAVNLAHITHVRLVDVVGDGSNPDTDGRPVFDPYPTKGSAGFDLDAMGAHYIKLAGDNTPPNQPALVAPADGSVGVSLAPTLEAGPFSDPNTGVGDFHSLTRWQITKTSGDYSAAQLVLDATSGEALTSLTILNALVPNTDYFWRVTYYDGDWAASPWSLENQLTTTVVDPDGDSNGIPDTQELPGGSLVDLNDNSIPDVTEINAQFKVLDTVTGQGPIAVQAPAGVTIALAQSTDPADVPALTVRPEPEDFVRGLISLRLTGLAPGSQVQITVYLNSAAPAGYGWYSYDPAVGWSLFSGAAFSADRLRVVLTLTDGGAGDADGVANGVILDPSGVARANLSASLTTSSGSAPVSGSAGVGGGGGCFLAGLPQDSHGTPLSGLTAPALLLILVLLVGVFCKIIRKQSRVSRE